MDLILFSFVPFDFHGAATHTMMHYAEIFISLNGSQDLIFKLVQCSNILSRKRLFLGFAEMAPSPLQGPSKADNAASGDGVHHH